MTPRRYPRNASQGRTLPYIPFKRRMHRPNPKRPVAEQDKRSVIAIERGDVEQWLFGDARDAQTLLRLAPVEVFNAAPVS